MWNFLGQKEGLSCIGGGHIDRKTILSSNTVIKCSISSYTLIDRI